MKTVYGFGFCECGCEKPRLGDGSRGTPVEMTSDREQMWNDDLKYILILRQELLCKDTEIADQKAKIWNLCDALAAQVRINIMQGER